MKHTHVRRQTIQSSHRTWTLPAASFVVRPDRVDHAAARLLPRRRRGHQAVIRLHHLDPLKAGTRRCTSPGSLALRLVQRCGGHPGASAARSHCRRRGTAIRSAHCAAPSQSVSRRHRGSIICSGSRFGPSAVALSIASEWHPHCKVSYLQCTHFRKLTARGSYAMQ